MGHDFLAHPFWDKCLEFEERLEAHDRVFAILAEIIHIPLHQYARYFERYRNMAANRPLAELAPADVIANFSAELSGNGTKQKTEAQMEQELRARLDQYHLDIFQHTQTETTKRWTYEQEVKRPYYHVTDLDEAQLANWRKYLDFEESEGEYSRIKFLYERCLVTAANYDEFWFRYARWMLSQEEEKKEEVRNIYQRASCVFVPISRPAIRLYYAQFEESLGYTGIANDIYEAILMILPNHLETIISLANLHRRQHGPDAAVATLKRHIDSQEISNSVRGALVSEWARLVADSSGQADAARHVYESNKGRFQNCKAFWLNWFFFEIKQQAHGQKEQEQHYKRVNNVYESIRFSRLPWGIVKDVTSFYLVYLKERCNSDAMAEFMRLDGEVNGPASVQKGVNDHPESNDEDVAVLGMQGADAHESIFVAGQGGLAMFPQAANGPAQGANGSAGRN